MVRNTIDRQKQVASFLLPADETDAHLRSTDSASWCGCEPAVSYMTPNAVCEYTDILFRPRSCCLCRRRCELLEFTLTHWGQKRRALWTSAILSTDRSKLRRFFYPPTKVCEYTDILFRPRSCCLCRRRCELLEFTLRWRAPACTV
jgi:hypothetical protein